VAAVSCDDGFALPDGKLMDWVECVSTGGEYPEAIWNITNMQCQREFAIKAFRILSSLYLLTISLNVYLQVAFKQGKITILR
jgi:hypothetical protein